MSIKGPDVQRFNMRLKKVTGAKLAAARLAARIATEECMTESKLLCPVDTGNLRSTGHVQEKVEGDKVIYELGYGGTAAPYAVAVHENLSAHHAVGQAKYLEVPFTKTKESAPGRIAAAMKKVE